MKKILNKILLIFIFFALLIILCGCDVNEYEVNIKDKIEEELMLIDENSFNIVKKIVKNEYGDNEKIDFKKIGDDVSRISDDFEVLFLDLNEFKIENDKLSELRIKMDNLVISIQNEDINGLLLNINLIENDISEILRNNLKDENKGKLKQIKSKVLLSYIYKINDDNENVKIQVDEIQKIYNELSNNDEFIENQSYNYNKIYVLIEEYKNIILEDGLGVLTKDKFIKLINEI